MKNENDKKREKAHYSIAIGNRIKNLRELEGLTMEALAKKMKSSRESISRTENGWNCPSIGKLCKIAKALKVNVSDIVDVLDDIKNDWGP